MLRLEATILKNLIYSEPYMRKVIPFLKEAYFKEPTERIVFKEIAAFVDKFKNPPTHEALVINLTESRDLKEEQVRDAVELLKQVHLDRKEPTDLPWLNVQTEKFCQDSALYNAVLEAVSIMDDTKGGPEKKSKGSIPEILTQALAVSFDPHVGHDYMEQSDSRFDFYHHKEKKIPFDLEFFNKITGGGFSIKTLNILLAGTGVGKTLVMCHMAAAALARGYNVLYITMEMAEERIAERIDANLLNVDINLLEQIPKIDYDKKFAALRSKTHGKLIIKEYPTASASTLHFRALLNELALKKSFQPDLIFIDYLNICASSRIRQGGNVNSYTYIKAIAEELRGLAVENKVPIVSATQTTRGGFDNSDLELTDTSESFGLPATADFMAAIISTDELDQLNQFMIKVLKNRYMDKNVNKKFVVGVDRPKMRLYDVASSAQVNISQSGQAVPAADRKPFERVKRDFKGLKV
jgi:replicative DNA helicase